jgi:GDPmannose 4,6-dehydratase
MTSALIIGCDGQDGKLLYDHLSSKNYELTGISRFGIRGLRPISIDRINILKPDQVNTLLQVLQPNEIYYLAAFHHSSEDVPLGDVELYRNSHEVHVDGLLNFLDGIKQYTPNSRIFYAVSSHIFGDAIAAPQDESTPISPDSPYGITKANGYHLIRYYRERHGMFACNGILYNHESALREQRFVSQKIITAAIDIKRGLTSGLVLGDLSATTDWGYAPDYVAAMKAILAADYPDDYVIATGIPHTVQEFVEITFGFLELDWRQYVTENSKIIGRKRVNLIGNSEKLRKLTGWKPSVDLKQMIHILLTAKGAFHD